MAISVGISRIVILDSYPEDGIAILNQARVEISKLEKNDVLSWITDLNNIKV